MEEVCNGGRGGQWRERWAVERGDVQWSEEVGNGGIRWAEEGGVGQ